MKVKVNKSTLLEAIGVLVTAGYSKLAESVLSVYHKNISAGNIAFDVFKNPTLREVSSLLKDEKKVSNVKKVAIRGLITGSKKNSDLYVWTSSINEITKGTVIGHQALIYQLKLSSFIPVMIFNDSIEFSSWHYKNSDLAKKYPDPKKLILNNKYIKRLNKPKYMADNTHSK